MADEWMDCLHLETRIGMNLQALGINPNPGIQAIREIGPATAMAYDTTLFDCQLPDCVITLSPGEMAPDLDEHLKQWECDCWCFITACNPRSQQLDDEANRERQRILGDVLRMKNEYVFDGVGRSASGDWYEQSFFVAGIDFLQAEALAIIFEQNAILIGQRGGPAELLFI
ncbi:DUF3293 domain-containing protein [Mangrovimicrobium sediminis]|uniref:DUF3293 domain-containing protein n=1 Tax=Mangrovimicrobium sediminis TaxID=2562682 RepID=A0A4Z0LXS7_9GAMM|nr:DUF3293 domain-containing protein [Haliea sp. SAOS-164]TGD72183.1 DUF3293 domain-containing protein [Haliea sp. SAOS-164]